VRLLYVEDNARLAHNTAASLRKSSFVVDVVTSGEDALHAAKSFDYDAIILDLGLPDLDGLTVLDGIRKARPGAPVIICTARDTLEDRVTGLNAGSDDYLVKPYEIVELVARIRAVLRRPGGALGVDLRVGNLSLNTVDREVLIDGEVVQLSRRELALLELFLRRKGRILSRDAIENALYGFDDAATPNAIEVATHRLRKRLQELGVTARIQTLRGIGYILEDDGK
jgi:DNA-binding response OmpR family regulator